MNGEVKTLVFADGVTVSAPISAATGVNVALTWTAGDSPKTIDVSASVPDATKVAWTLCKGSAADYEQILATITKPSTTEVTITVEVDLDAGDYFLQGVY